MIDGQTTTPLVAFAEAVKKRPAEKALVLGQWKLLAYLDEDRYELYDLNADPTEQHDLAAEQPQRVAELTRLLEKQIEENEALGAGVAVQEAAMTPEELERLRLLGYIDEPEDEASGPEADTQPSTEDGSQP